MSFSRTSPADFRKGCAHVRVNFQYLMLACSIFVDVSLCVNKRRDWRCPTATWTKVCLRDPCTYLRVLHQESSRNHIILCTLTQNTKLSMGFENSSMTLSYRIQRKHIHVTISLCDGRA